MDFEKSYTLKEVYELYVHRNKSLDEMQLSSILIESHYLFEKMAHSLRYQNIRILSYINDIDKELIKQFSAMTLQLEDQRLVIAYRGTDDTLVGWHEDFLMLCENVVPAQISSAEYLHYISQYQNNTSLIESLKNRHLDSSLFQRIKKHFQYKKNCPLWLVGHSKGGNLAMYAACLRTMIQKSESLKLIILMGQDFRMKLWSHHNIKTCYHVFIAIYLTILFLALSSDHEEQYTVVHSHYTGMLQHNGFSWEVAPQHFVDDELSFESVQFAIKVILFLEKLTNEEKHQFVEAMFGTL